MIIADIQTPTQLMPALSTVAPKKPHAPGEEQIRTKSQGETLHKQYNTSEYSNPVKLLVEPPAQTKAIYYLIVMVQANLPF